MSRLHRIKDLMVKRDAQQALCTGWLEIAAQEYEAGNKKALRRVMAVAAEAVAAAKGANEQLTAAQEDHIGTTGRGYGR